MVRTWTAAAARPGGQINFKVFSARTQPTELPLLQYPVPLDGTTPARAHTRHSCAAFREPCCSVRPMGACSWLRADPRGGRDSAARHVRISTPWSRRTKSLERYVCYSAYVSVIYEFYTISGSVAGYISSHVRKARVLRLTGFRQHRTTLNRSKFGALGYQGCQLVPSIQNCKSDAFKI